MTQPTLPRRALLAAAPAVAGVTARGYADLIDGGHVPGNYAIVLGLLDGLLDVPRLEAVAAELYAFCAGWVAAAVRLGLTDHLTVQWLLRRVRPALAAAAEQAAVGEVDLISPCAPLVSCLCGAP